LNQVNAGPVRGPARSRARASLADFGNEDVAREEAAIESGAPLAIPAVPPIPTLPVQAANGELATVGLRGTRARPPQACGALNPPAPLRVYLSKPRNFGLGIRRAKELELG